MNYKNDGEHLDSEIVYDKLIVSEKGISSFLDLDRLNFTIISNNCVRGLIYKQLGFQYRTSFVGWFILPDGYYKITKDFRYYMEQELVFEEELISPSCTHEVYPLGHLGDIDIHFLHYKNLKSQCVTPGQEHLPELVIMPESLNNFDVMGWLKKEAMLSKYKLLRYRI